MPALSPFIRTSKNEDGTQLWITGEIGYDVRFADLQRAFSYYDAEDSGEITVNLYSHGGSLDDATAFYDWAQAQGLKFKVNVWGAAMSAATIIAAAAGAANISMAPNAVWMIHECSGATIEMCALGNDALARIYNKLTGLKDAKIREMMASTKTLDAQQAVEMGFAGKVMKNTMKLAAMYDAKPIEQKTIAMSDKKKLKVTATVHLTTMEAARAAFSDKGTVAEVEIDMEQATADAMAGKDTEIAQKDTEIEALKKKVAELEAAKPEDQTPKVEALAKEVEGVKAEVTAKDKEIEALKAQIKAPVAGKTVANNAAATIGSTGTTETESDKAAKRFSTTANALDREMTAVKA